jgi:putative Ca2+/H+ antiporter (TMEM165/GDT1 family)
MLGEAARLVLPVLRITILAGAAFIGFGLRRLKGDELDDEERLSKGHFGPLMTVAATFFRAELGDKTMLATVTIASQQQSFIGVWLGSTLGMVVAGGVAIIVGKVMGRRLPERGIKYGAALVFIAASLYTLLTAVYG